MIRSLFFLARSLPERLAIRIGAGLGRLAYYFLPGRRAVGRQNLALAFPELSRRERRRILIRSCENLGRTLMEIVRLAAMTDEEIRRRVSYSSGSLENWEEAQRHGKGILYITGHIGNWELLALGHSLHGYPMRLAARRLDNPLLETELNDLRGRGGNKVSERGGGGRRIRDMIKQLRGGGQVGILVDQYARGSNGIMVPFFGKLAASHRGPAVLAARTGARLLPSFLRRDAGKPGRYQIHFGPEVVLEPSGNAEEDVRSLTARLQAVLEAEIRSRPEEWFWLHCRWKKSPDAPELYGGLQKKWRKHRFLGQPGPQSTVEAE